MKRNTNKKELANSVFEILNDLMGDIHGARITGFLAIKKPEIYMTKYPRYVIRSSISVIALSLRKFDDLWSHQIGNLLLKNFTCNEGQELHNEIKKRKIRKFCNVVIAHYAESKKLPKTSNKELEKLISQQGFRTDEEFFLWTKDVIEKIEAVRDLVKKEYNKNPQ